MEEFAADLLCNTCRMKNLTNFLSAMHPRFGSLADARHLCHPRGVLPARIAVIGVVVCALHLGAQQVAKGNLTIRVTDQTGAVVPGARIEIDLAKSEADSVLRTDNQGEFTCDLSAGPHTISVFSPDFFRWKTQINIQGKTDQRLAATLEVAFYSGPMVVAIYPSLFPELPKEAILLPTVPLATLPLAPKPARKHPKRANL